MQTNNEILIDYLDGQLSREESDRVEIRVKSDGQFAGELEYMRLAIDTVRQGAILNKVSSIRQSFENNRTSTAKPAVIRSMYKISLRIAAVFILLIGVTVLYKYISVSSQTLYEKEFTGYELSNTRGQSSNDAEIEAFRNKSWNDVITIHATETSHSNKSNFLTAIAEMQLKHFPQAVTLFESVLNSKSGDNSYEEEAEYYISLAYLMNKEENKAIRMLDKIKADPTHTYYPLASKISGIDLKIIELKK
jgi:hypothetical protein